MNIPNVSVIITNYNYEKYILECLTSVLNQSLKPFDCIIVDDVSTDSSIEIIQKFIDENTNQKIKFSLIRHTENKGQMGAFLTGLKACEGEFIAFLDADDVWKSDFLKDSIDAHLNQKAAFVFCDYNEIGEKSELLAKSVYSNLYKKQVETELYTLSEKAIGNWHWCPTSSAVFRKKSLEYFTGMNIKNWRICADALLFNYAHFIGDSVYLNKPLMNYRLHQQNGSGIGYPAGNATYTSKAGREKIDKAMSGIIPELFDILLANRECQSKNMHGIEYRVITIIAPMPLNMYKKYYKQVKCIIGTKLANKFMKRKIIKKLFGFNK